MISIPTFSSLSWSTISAFSTVHQRKGFRLRSDRSPPPPLFPSFLHLHIFSSCLFFSHSPFFRLASFPVRRSLQPSFHPFFPVLFSPSFPPRLTFQNRPKSSPSRFSFLDPFRSFFLSFLFFRPWRRHLMFLFHFLFILCFLFSFIMVLFLYTPSVFSTLFPQRFLQFSSFCIPVLIYTLSFLPLIYFFVPSILLLFYFLL